MKRLITILFIVAASLWVPIMATASELRTEWWWRVIEWIMDSGGTWNVW